MTERPEKEGEANYPSVYSCCGESVVAVFDNGPSERLKLRVTAEESDAKFRIIMIEITGFSTAPRGKGLASSKERLGGSCEIVF